MADGSPPAERAPNDLVAAVALTLLTAAAVLVPPIRGTSIATALSTAFVLLVPGYVLLRTLAYRRGSRQRTASLAANASAGDWTTLIERTVLSVALSLLLAAGVGFALRAAPVEAGSPLIVVTLCSLALLTTGMAFRYRQRLAWVGWRGDDATRPRTGGVNLRETLRPRSRTDLAVTVVLVGVVAAIAVGGAYVVASPGGGPSHTTLTLLNDDGEQLTAANYPDELSAGEPASLVVEVRNEEGESTTYTVVVQLQRVEDGSPTATTEVDRFELAADTGETVRYEHELPARSAGPTGTTGDGELRLVYLLYVGPPPEEPTAENAYRSVHLSFENAESSSGGS